MQAELSQKEAKELLSALQREADSWKQNHTITETFQLCTTPRPQRTQHMYMPKGRNTRQAHSGDTLRAPSLSPGELGHASSRSKCTVDLIIFQFVYLHSTRHWCQTTIEISLYNFCKSKIQKYSSSNLPSIFSGPLAAKW